MLLATGVRFLLRSLSSVNEMRRQLIFIYISKTFQKAIQEKNILAGLIYNIKLDAFLAF